MVEPVPGERCYGSGSVQRHDHRTCVVPPAQALGHRARDLLPVKPARAGLDYDYSGLNLNILIQELVFRFNSLQKPKIQHSGSQDIMS
jgi:hypothetical protein